MSVVLSVEDVGTWKKELKVEIPEPAVTAELARVVGSYARKANLPGFRKGKVPQSLIKKRFSDEIRQEVIERLVPRYWSQAQSESEIDPMMGPEIQKVEVEEGKPMVFTATVEVRPEIELSDDREFDLPDDEIEIKESEVDEVLERIRSDVGTWAAVEREAAAGDLVEILMKEAEDHAHGHDHDHEADDGGEGHAHGEGKDGQTVEVEIGDPRVWEELSLALTGKKVGQSGEFTRSHTAAHEEGEEPHTHEHSFEFEVIGVQEKELPELNDELAKKIGDFENLEVLKQQIRANMQTERRNQVRQTREKALLDQLREKNPIELPAGVVEHEIDLMLQDYAQNLMRSGVNLETAGIDWSGMRESAREQAQARLHSRLLLDAFAEKDQVEATEMEIGRVIDQIAAAEGASAVAVRTRLMEEGKLDGLKNQIRRDKALRRLLGDETPLFPSEEPADPVALAADQAE